MKTRRILLILSCVLIVYIGYKLLLRPSQDTSIQNKDISKLNIDLYWASYDGNFEKVKELIKQGANVNSTPLPQGGKDGDLTPLHQAVILGRINKSDYDSNSKLPNQPYIKNRLSLAKLLIENGANVNATTRYGVSPLHKVEIKEIAVLLIDSGAKVDAREYFNEKLTPLFEATQKYRKQGIAEVLINHGANVNQETPDGITPLMRAAAEGNQEVAKLLIDRGADVNHKDKDSLTALELAFQSKNNAIVQLLIDKGAALTGESYTGNSNLHYAVEHNDIEMLKKLLAKSADIDPVNVGGITPLMQATRDKNKEIIELLINHGANIDYVNKDGRTSLVESVFENNIEIAELLIKKGANVNFSSEKNWNNRPTICFAENKEMMYLFLNNGADVNAKDGDGKDLHYCLGDKKELVEMIENSTRNKARN